MWYLTKSEFVVIGIIFGMILIPIHHAEAAEWKLYVGEMPKHWEPQFGNLLYHATQFWQKQFPDATFYKVSNLEDADFVVQWASEYQADKKTKTKRLGYYTTNTRNEFGKPYVAITLGFMTGEGINKEFQLVDKEYALLITVHELGHAIGLGHSDNPNDIMYPSIYNYPEWLEQRALELRQSDQTTNDSVELKSPNLTETKSIPAWIKNNAGWWANGQINDDEFVSGIQYMIKNKIIDIQIPMPNTSGENSQEIPKWIKNNAEWWADDIITEIDFLNGIRYMIENRIIDVN